MAINPIHLLTASTAKATNGSSTIEVFGSIDTSRLFQGSVVTLGTFAAVEAISGTPVDSSGNSTITLFQPWPEATTTARLSAFNSIEGLTGAIEKSRQVVANTSAIEDLSGTGFLERTGPTTYALNTVTTQAKSFLNDSTASEQRDTLKLGDAEVFPNPLDFGLGISGNTIASLPKTSLDDLTIAGGVFRVINTNTGTRPEGFSQFGVVAVWRYDSKLISQIYIDANGKKASRVIKDTGVGDWDIEFNSGNSVNPLDFGLGTPNARLSTDLNLENVGSTVRFTTATANTPTDFGTCYVGGYNNTNTTQLVVSTSQRQAFFRNKTNGTWNTWQELFHTANSVNPLDFGLGNRVAGQLADLTDNTVTDFGRLGWWGSNTNNVFGGLSSNFGGFINIPVAGGAFSQFGLDLEGDMFTQYANKTARKVFDSGNSVNPLDFGIGVRLTDAPILTDFKANNKSGLYRCTLANTTNGPETLSFFASVIVEATSVGAIYTVSRSSTDKPKTYSGVYVVSSNTISWIELFTSGNTNFNEFYLTNGERLATSGTRVTSTQVDFGISLNSTVEPVSITKSGVFNIVDNDTGSIVASGVTPNLSTSTHSKLLVLSFTVTSTTATHTYRAVSSGTTTLKVNF